MRTSDAIAHFGSVPALARVLGISRNAVYQWGRFVPRARAYELMVRTHGALSIQSMNTKLDPRERNGRAAT